MTPFICALKSLFATYEPYDGIVKISNNSTSIKLGIDSVNFKMFDEAMRTLENVRHISDMSKSLISLPILEYEVYKFTGHDGVLKESKSIIIAI